MDQQNQLNAKGVAAAFVAPLFLGMAPIFGKMAVNAGSDAFTVAALRTLVAVALLWVFYLLFFRKYIYIYPAGFLGCTVIGIINGIGSLFYYGGLERLDASLVQLVNGMYLAFAVLLSRIGGQKADGRTLIRVALAMLALFLLTGFGAQSVDWTGVGLMLGNGLMFAGTLILSQYVLYEMPSPTVALYILTTMGVVVTIVWMAVGQPISNEVFQASIGPIVALGVTTALSRVAMFAGVKFMGGMQTAILAVAEIAVTLSLAFFILHDRLTATQWLGVGILVLGILLIRQRDLLPRGYNPAALIAANMNSVQFQRIAFHRAFGTHETDDVWGTMSQITTQEMLAIKRMMGAEVGGIDPFPIGKSNQMNARTLEAIEDVLDSQEIDLLASLNREAPTELHIPEDLSDIEEADDAESGV